MAKNIKNRKGNIAIVLFAIVIVLSLSLNSLIILDRKTLSIKRQNIHDAVIAADLSSYYAIEQGSKSTVRRYNPDRLTNYLSDPNTIVEDRIQLEDLVNFMDSEYFQVGERYKSIYIRPDVAYNYFSDYLKNNLNLKNDSEYVYSAKSNENNKGDIVQLNIEKFQVYNAIYVDLDNRNIPYDVPSELEDQKYTGIHLELSAKVKRTAVVNSSLNEVNIPINLDTNITLYRPTIK